MSETLKVRIGDKLKEYPIGILLERIADEYQEEYDHEIVGCVLN